MEKEININEFSPLTFAYLGDAVFEIKVRKYILEKGNKPVNKLHNIAKNYVNASSQAIMYNYIFDKVSEEEQHILLRGRNAKSYSTSKNASIIDYRHATGVEALFGYLELKEDFLRVEQVFRLCLEAIEEK